MEEEYCINREKNSRTEFVVFLSLSVFPPAYVCLLVAAPLLPAVTFQSADLSSHTRPLPVISGMPLASHYYLLSLLPSAPTVLPGPCLKTPMDKHGMKQDCCNFDISSQTQ